MNENEARADFLHEYLKDTPHLFSLDSGKAVSARGTGKEVLLMWARLSQAICDQIGADNINELNKMAVMAAVEYLGELLDEMQSKEG